MQTVRSYVRAAPEAREQLAGSIEPEEGRITCVEGPQVALRIWIRREAAVPQLHPVGQLRPVRHQAERVRLGARDASGGGEQHDESRGAHECHARDRADETGRETETNDSMRQGVIHP